MKILLILLLILSLLGNFYLLFLRNSSSVTPQDKLTSIDLQKYHLLSSKILKDYDKDLLIHFTPLRHKLKELISKEFNNNVTLYFEYLPTGTSIGVNDTIEFNAASLLKLPSVMAYYHYKERTRLKDDPKVILEEKDIDNHFGNLWRTPPGTKISLKEAVVKTLTESDNTALNLIERQYSDVDTEHIYDGLDINPNLNPITKKALITTKSYSSILKSLYYSSVLKKENSQYILSLLTQSIFKDMLGSGIPSNIPVAHKVGIWEKENTNIYSDCGIIYVPQRPYLLCIASNSDLSTSKARIRTISNEVYNFIITSPKPTHP